MTLKKPSAPCKKPPKVKANKKPPEAPPQAAPVPEELIPQAEPIAEASFGDDPFGEMGGGSLLDPLDEEMDSSVNSSPRQTGASLSSNTNTVDIRETLASPLARMVSEIRRSFDFYEHQLYERPVNRLILTRRGRPFYPSSPKSSRMNSALKVSKQQSLSERAVSRRWNSQPPNCAITLRNLWWQLGSAARGMADL